MVENFDGNKNRHQKDFFAFPRLWMKLPHSGWKLWHYWYHHTKELPQFRQLGGAVHVLHTLDFFDSSLLFDFQHLHLIVVLHYRGLRVNHRCTSSINTLWCYMSLVSNVSGRLQPDMLLQESNQYRIGTGVILSWDWDSVPHHEVLVATLRKQIVLTSFVCRECTRQEN